MGRHRDLLGDMNPVMGTNAGTDGGPLGLQTPTLRTTTLTSSFGMNGMKHTLQAASGRTSQKWSLRCPTANKLQFLCVQFLQGRRYNLLMTAPDRNSLESEVSGVLQIDD